MNGAAMLDLQVLDSQLDQIGQRRKRLPERAALAEANAAHGRWLEERRRLDDVVAGAVKVIETCEAEGAQLDAKQARLEQQLKTVIAPREAEALMSEIATLKARHGELDDAELAAMEQQAEAETALGALTDIEPALLGSVREAQEALDAALADLAAEEDEVRARRAAAAEALTEGERATYESLRARHGGVGIARVEGRTCTGCHVELSRVEFERVATEGTGGSLPECPHCARSLVL